jgi:hypothetical protein
MSASLARILHPRGCCLCGRASRKKPRTPKPGSSLRVWLRWFPRLSIQLKAKAEGSAEGRSRPLPGASDLGADAGQPA